MADITAQFLRSVLKYDAEAGTFTWLIHANNNGALAGSRAGSRNRHGYWQAAIRGRRYGLHRLAWLYVHGEWPAGEVDHIDGDPSNNRLSNLRVATSQENKRNARLRADNTTGLKGVTWDAVNGKYRAKIQVDGRTVHLGRFATSEEAHRAYAAAARAVFGQFARVA